MKKRASNSHLNTIPGFFLPYIDEYCDQLGIDSAGFWESAGLARHAFRPLQEKISEDQLYRFVSAALRQTPAAFGFEIGERISIASYGLVSRAVMSCGNLRRSTDILSRFSHLAMPLVEVSGSAAGDNFVVELVTTSNHAELNRVMVEAIVANMRSAYKLLAATPLEIEHACFAFPDPGYSASVTAAIAKKVTFSADRNLVHVAREVAERPFLTASQTEEALSLQECEVALRQCQRFSEQVRDQIRRCLDASPTSFEVARRLHMSERSLRRLLAKDGASYRALMQEVRESQAKYYLGQTGLNIAQVTAKLGYVETSNFRSAFKRWTGQSPSVWRNANTGTR